MKLPGKISRRRFVANLMSSAAFAGLAPSALWAGRAAFRQDRRRPTPDRVEPQARPFALGQVRLLDGPFLEAAKANQAYLHTLPVERLVHNFRVNAGLPSATQPFGGWEAPDCELRGHFTGHFLSACALNYASFGDEVLKARGEAAVAELAACQQKAGNGYLSAFPEEFFDRLRDGKKVWAPFYTLHKIMAGCLDMHTHCASVPALAAVEGLAQWIGRWADGLSDAHLQRILGTEYGGIAGSLYNLSALSGNREYFRTAARFEQPRFLDPLSGHRDELKELHTNTHIPKVIAAARRYELTGDPYYRDAARYFWEEVTQERTYATGGTSNDEVWDTDPGKLGGALSVWSAECCCAYNMLKLSRHLFQWSADPRYMDYYERTLFNSRLGTQHPANGLKMYYVPLETGYWKYFNSPSNSFWCCTGTGAEEFSKFADSICFHNDREIFVNLFIASEVRWPETGLTLRQETRFPEEEVTRLTISVPRPVEAGLNIRIPGWVAEGGSVVLNGQTHSAFSSPSSYLKIRREWRDGDRVEVRLPMRLRAEPLPGDPTRQAVLCGPIVLAARLGSDGLTEEMQYDAASGPTKLATQGKPAGTAAVVLKKSSQGASPAGLAREEAPDWLVPVKGQPLSFVTTGQPSVTQVVPLYRIFGERYAVYWRVGPDSA
jgi:DUF1680 family protein